jgi:TetR/AcrR family tetracycline transcriptional repressor
MALSREEVLRGAMRLLDRVGLDGLTMRRLANELDVQAGAIYWHFANKQALQDAMADELTEGLLEPPPKGAWDTQLAELSRRLANALIRRRDGARLATSALTPGPNGLAASERMLRIARDAGFSKKATLWATSVLGYYVLGYVTDVQAAASARARGLGAAELRSIEKAIDPKQYPELFAASSGGLQQMMTSHAFRERFEFGLKVILEGLKKVKRGTGRRRS